MSVLSRALNVTLNSVVFRSADQDLTTAGTYIEMTSRLAEPVLLVGLAVLDAIRNRVKPRSGPRGSAPRAEELGIRPPGRPDEFAALVADFIS
ncbi:hypothetical protein ACW4TU_45195 (plasmid) [Streptomyces sp. QTS52]